MKKVVGFYAIILIITNNHCEHSHANYNATKVIMMTVTVNIMTTIIKHKLMM